MANASDADHRPANRTADWLGARAPIVAGGQGRRRALRAVKIALPLIAAAMVGAIFAWPNLFGKTAGRIALNFSGLPALEDNELRMTNPRFTGVDAQNRAYTVTAAMATQSLEDHKQIALDTLEAEIVLGDGSWLSVRASSGEIHTGRQQLRLSGVVDAYSDRGYEFHGASARFDLAAGAMQSDEPIRAQGALGQLRANSMRAEDRGQLVSFSGEVRVILYPRRGGPS